MSIHPIVFFVVTVVLLFVSTYAGSWFSGRYREEAERNAGPFKTLESAVLALLGLLLGFTFSMAISRYNDRKQGEIAEANAISTVWLRTATLAEPARSEEQQLLRSYVKIRLDFLLAGTSRQDVSASLDKTAAMQNRLWSVAVADTNARRDPVSALFLASLNEAIDDAEVRTAAYEDRIPGTVWVLLLFISVVSSVIVGAGISERSRLLRAVLPLVVAAALAQTLDLDSPRSGLIRMQQRSMDRVARQLMEAPPAAEMPVAK